MAVILQPHPPWTFISATLCVIVVSATFVGMVRGTWSRTPGRGAGVLGFSILAASLFGFAAWDPRIVESSQVEGVHLAVVLDVSGSILRIEGEWQAVQATVRPFVRSMLDSLPVSVADKSEATIITFGESAQRSRSALLDQLMSDYNRINPSEFPLANGTDLGDALERAGDAIGESGARGVVLLATDGNETIPGSLDAATELAQRGIPVFILPLESPGPAVSIASAYLPNRVESGVPVFFRSVFINASQRETEAVFSLAQNPGLDDADSEMISVVERSAPFSIPFFGDESSGLRHSGQAHVREQIVFEGLGIEFVDAILDADQGGQTTQHVRRVFTHVSKPPKIMAFGGDLSWAALIPSDRMELAQLTPGQFDEDQLMDTDVIVLSDVTANQFSDQALDSIAQAVKESGKGLFVINGVHMGRSEDEHTTLMSYEDTVIGPLLPVSSDPEPFIQEPPPRNVIISIDASGSMSGRPLEQAREIARFIVETYLRPVDRLDLMAFTTGVAHLIQELPMDTSGKSEAIRQINSITAGGGTDPREALRLIENRRLANCGLIFISDGGFDYVSARPDCRSTVFAIGQSNISPGSPLHAIADPFPVGPNFSPKNIRIPFFEPEPEDKFFEPGLYTPAASQHGVPQYRQLPIPDLPVDGNAITFPKEGADVMAVRPKFTKPILAFREAGEGYVGVFTTGVPRDWRNSTEASEALVSWLEALIPYVARDRYDFEVVDRGDEIEISIAIGEGGALPDVTRLEVTLEFSDGDTYEIPMRLTDEAATFVGKVRPDRGESAKVGTLIVREFGSEALPRPQRVPIVIPARGSRIERFTEEDASYGLNAPLLQQIADVGGGQYDPPLGTQLIQDLTKDPEFVELWHWLLILGGMSFIGFVAFQRIAF